MTSIPSLLLEPTTAMYDPRAGEVANAEHEAEGEDEMALIPCTSRRPRITPSYSSSPSSRRRGSYFACHLTSFLTHALTHPPFSYPPSSHPPSFILTPLQITCRSSQSANRPQMDRRARQMLREPPYPGHNRQQLRCRRGRGMEKSEKEGKRELLGVV